MAFIFSPAVPAFNKVTLVLQGWTLVQTRHICALTTEISVCIDWDSMVTSRIRIVLLEVCRSLLVVEDLPWANSNTFFSRPCSRYCSAKKGIFHASCRVWRIDFRTCEYRLHPYIIHGFVNTNNGISLLLFLARLAVFPGAFERGSTEQLFYAPSEI